jgi:hypothetical protein
MFIHKLDTAIFAMYSSIPQSSDNVIYPRHCSLILHIQDECFFPFSLHLCCTLCLNRPTTISTPDVNASADSVSAGVSSRRTEDHAAEIQAQGLSEHFVQWIDQGETFWF